MKEDLTAVQTHINQASINRSDGGGGVLPRGFYPRGFHPMGIDLMGHSSKVY